VKALFSTCALVALAAIAPQPARAALQAGCPAAEYVYAGARLLAVVKPEPGKAGFLAGSSVVPEAVGTASFSVQVVSVPAGCPIPSAVVVNYTLAGAAPNPANPGKDYVDAAGSLTFAADTVGGTVLPVLVTILNDATDEPNETFVVTLTSPDPTVLIPFTTQTVTITDDDLPPTVSVSDVVGYPAGQPTGSVLEDDGFSQPARFDVTLSAATSFTTSVRYTTANGTATTADYAPLDGVLTFPPGTTTLPVVGAVTADTLDEPNETFFLNLSEPSNGTLTLGDAQGLATIVDNDPQSTVFVGADVQLQEGDEGTHFSAMSIGVVPSGYPITVNYSTANGTAVQPSDYQAVSGTLTFVPGEATLKNIPLAIVADSVVEPTEAFFFNLSGATNATISDNQASITIFNDDAAFVPSVEIPPGTEQFAHLAATPGPVAAVHLYRLGQKPRSSYEVVVDSESADVDNGFGIIVRRYASDQTTELDNAVVIPSGTVNRRMRWTNTEFVSINQEFIKVQSSGCTTNCGIDDVYRIRTFDTTYSIPRFNNSGTQATVLVVQNTTSSSIIGTIDFWDAAGTYLASASFVAPGRRTFVLDTSSIVPGASGSITITNNGSYADLVGKAVAIEPATGLSFDTAMSPRPLK
jgi:hypothetical protein